MSPNIFSRTADQTTVLIASYVASILGGDFKKRGRNVFLDPLDGRSFYISSASLGITESYWFDIYDDRLKELQRAGSLIFGFADSQTFFWSHHPCDNPAFNSIKVRQRPDGRTYRQVYFTKDRSGNFIARHAPLNVVLIADTLPGTKTVK